MVGKRGSRKSKLIILRLGSHQVKGMSVTYFLVFTCRTVIQSLASARRTSSGNSWARQNNLFYMMSTWAGLASNSFLQLLLDAEEDEGWKVRTEASASYRNTVLSTIGWEKQVEQGSPSSRSLQSCQPEDWALHLGRRFSSQASFPQPHS